VSRKKYKTKVKAQKIRKSRQDWDRAKYLTDNVFEAIDQVADKTGTKEEKTS
jgi:hypothetical protein